MNNKRNTTLWGIGTAGEGFISSMSTTYLSLFLTDVALLPVGLASTVLMITSIMGFVMATITGGIIATIKPMKWGRLRSWLLVGPPACVVFFILHFTSFPGKPMLSAVVITLGYFIGITMWNFAYASDISLTNLMANTQEERNKFNAQRMMGSNVGRLMGNYLTPILVAFIALHFTERQAYPILVLIAGVFFIVTELIQFRMCEGCEENYHEQTNTEDESIKLKDIVKILGTNHQLLVTLIIDLSSNMAALALPTLATYYYKNVFEMPKMIPTHMLCIGLAGLAGSSIIRVFGTKIKNYKSYLLTVYLVISLMLCLTRLASNNVYLFLGINIIIHGLTGTTQTFEMNLYQDNVIYSEWKTGVNANSLIMGLCEFPVKISSILKSIIISSILISTGYVAGEAPSMELKNAIANAYAFIPACIPLIGFIMLKFAYKLTPEKIAQYKKDIEARNSVEA